MAGDHLPPTSKTLLAKLANAANREEWNAAWRRLTDLYGPAILRWCARRGLQPADAEEVTQNVLLTFCERAVTWEYRRWLKTVVQQALSVLVGQLPAVCQGTDEVCLGQVLRKASAVDVLVEELMPEDPKQQAQLKGLANPADEAAWDDAWSNFKNLCGPTIFRWFSRWDLSPETAEAMSRLFLTEFARATKTVDEVSLPKFRSWLYAVVRNAARDCVSALAKAAPGTGKPQDPPAQDDFVRELEEQELHLEAETRVKQRVNPVHWQAYYLKIYDGCTGQQVAERLHMNVGAVYVAWGKVRKAVEEERRKLDSPAVES